MRGEYSGMRTGCGAGLRESISSSTIAMYAASSRGRSSGGRG
jgi:hypothetical protein